MVLPNPPEQNDWPVALDEILSSLERVSERLAFVEFESASRGDDDDSFDWGRGRVQ